VEVRVSPREVFQEADLIGAASAAATHDEGDFAKVRPRSRRGFARDIS
jgi:hypothetical protein